MLAAGQLIILYAREQAGYRRAKCLSLDQTVWSARRNKAQDAPQPLNQGLPFTFPLALGGTCVTNVIMSPGSEQGSS